MVGRKNPYLLSRLVRLQDADSRWSSGRQGEMKGDRAPADQVGPGPTLPARPPLLELLGWNRSVVLAKPRRPAYNPQQPPTPTVSPPHHSPSAGFSDVEEEGTKFGWGRGRVTTLGKST